MITIDPIKRPSKVLSSVDTEEIMKEIDLKISNLVGGAPETLNTLKKIANAIGDIDTILDNINGEVV